MNGTEFIDELLAAKRTKSAQETQQVDDPPELWTKARQPQIPAGLEPETFGLIHEYYTPLQIADAIAEHVCPLLPELAGHDGVVRVLEPSAGLGRFLRAMGRPQCINTGVAVVLGLPASAVEGQARRRGEYEISESEERGLSGDPWED